MEEKSLEQVYECPKCKCSAEGKTVISDEIWVYCPNCGIAYKQEGNW